MNNLIDEIQGLLSFEGLTPEQKVSAVAKLCKEETNNYEDLLTLRKYVKADIITDNFNIDRPEVAEEFYVRVCNLKKISVYESKSDI